MGKWAEVYCDCTDRVRLAVGRWENAPHHFKYPLTEKEQKEFDEWTLTTKDMFRCGHRNGAVVELWPHDIILLGNLIGTVFADELNAFEIFVKVGDWRCYEDEILLINPADAARWLIEVEELRRGLNKSGDFSHDGYETLILEFFRNDLDDTLDLERRVNEAAERMPEAVLVGLMENIQQSGVPDLQSTTQKILEALKETELLCNASLQTGNPVRMLW